jgi:hypothetical protein
LYLLAWGERARLLQRRTFQFMSLDLVSRGGAASLDLVAVADLSGTFFVPNYQRGYLWGVGEVRALLNDIYRHLGEH